MVGSSMFVGREPEMQRLVDALGEAGAGRGGFVTLVGEAGIGKTRTVEEFVRRTEMGRERVLWGRCPEHGGAPTYWPWTQAIRSYVETRDVGALGAELGGVAADVAELVPAVRTRLGTVEPAPVVDPDQRRFRLFDAVAGFLSRAAADAPLLLVLDDLHWADQASLALLEFVARDPRPSRLLLLGTYRELEMRRMSRLLAGIARVSQRVGLRGLARPEVERFITASAAVAPSAAMVERLYQTTEGNPFFLDELVQTLKTEGRLDAADGASGLRLPDGVREAIRHRLEPLTAEERRLLDVAAVVGREFDLGVLQAACELAAERVLERLAAPAQAGLVDEVPGAVGRFRFAHALIRETLYHDLLPAARVGLHRQVAHALEALHAGDDAPAAELAHHFYHAAAVGEGVKAIDFATRAGTRALDLLAYEEAVTQYERALGALAFVPPDERRRLDLLLALGDAAGRLGDGRKARDAFERAARIARAVAAPEALARAALGAGRARVVAGSVDHGVVALLEEALAALPAGDGRLRAALLGRLATALYFASDPTRRNGLGQEAVTMARRLGEQTGLAAALLAQHFLLWGSSTPTERLAVADEAHGLAAAARHRGLGLEAQSWRIVALLELGDLAAVERELADYDRHAAELRSPSRRWHATVIRAGLDLLAGRYTDAARHAAEALALRQNGYDPNVAQLYFVQRYVLARDVGGGEALLAQQLALAREHPQTRSWQAGLVLLLAESGDTAAASAEFDRLAAHDFADLPRDATYVFVLAFAAEVVATLGDLPRARLLYPLLAPYEERNVVISIGAASVGSAARYLGLLSATVGDHERAIRHFTTALAANRRLQAAPLVARTQADWARVLLARGRPGDRERAAELIAEARATAETLGMDRFRARLPAAGAPEGKVATAAGVLRRVGEVWELALGAERIELKETKGVTYLATLLRHPSEEFHVLALGGGEAPVGAAMLSAGEAIQAGLRVGDLGDAGDLLDTEARNAYKRRLADLREEHDEAERFNDPERADRAAREMEFLTDELARGIGLGGRSRRAAAAAEKARINVTRAMRTVLDRIGASCPLLGQHLAATVRTGLFCSYTPDPRTPVAWDVRDDAT